MHSNAITGYEEELPLAAEAVGVSARAAGAGQHYWRRAVPAVLLAAALASVAALSAAKRTGNSANELRSGEVDEVVIKAAVSNAGPFELEEIKETPGHLEWEVCSTEPAYVRMEKNPFSLIQAMRPSGALIIARQEGEWLAIFHDRGFVPMSSNGVVQVKERQTSYSRISEGTCHAVRRHPITDAAACEAAAVTLGLSDTSLQLSEGSQFKEAGCFWKNGGLWFSLTAGDGTSPVHDQELICSNQAYPALAVVKPPPTTTTTSTQAPTTTTTKAVATTTAEPAKAGTPTTTGNPTTSTNPEVLRPSLYCWCVAMVEKRGIQVDSEVALMSHVYRKGAGLFMCNQWTVFSDQVVPLDGEGSPKTTGVPFEMSKLGDVPQVGGKMLLNTNVFFRAWDKVLADGIWEEHDWTIKLDPDCVFFADRLRTHLRNGGYNPDENLYFKNCQRWGSMQGPVELYSRGAMGTFKSRIWECKQQINQDGIGEDIFMQKCTVQLGVQNREDWGLLDDKYCWHHDGPCKDGWTVAFHPYKSIAAWDQCQIEAIRQ
mmetsp:Transcript_16445/g.45245  ORF Transcript_16445/g.45245 Transcript_16445/m.45245 type:complete len:543 (-) Transcript_16445:117-1745(-)